MMRWFLLIALLAPFGANGSPTTDQLFSEANSYLSADRLAFADKRYKQVLVIEPSNRFALLRRRQIVTIEKAYAAYNYERAKIEGAASRDGSHFFPAGTMAPPELRLSEGQLTRIRNAYATYREQRTAILQSNP
jgi:hypothetical protein